MEPTPNELEALALLTALKGNVTNLEQALLRVYADGNEDVNEGKVRMTFGEESWWPGQYEPWKIPTDAPELKGIWCGFKETTEWGETGTLWHMNAYNVYGAIDGLEVRDIGDFVKGREGHGLYLRCVPWLDTTIRNYKAKRIGGQAIQREWRMSETELDGDGSGVFLVEDCEFLETGLIESGSAPRASWAMSLCNTGQETYVRNVVHRTTGSPPSNGSLFVGYGQDGYRTPRLTVKDCVFENQGADRSAIFLQGVDAGVIQNVELIGNRPHIDIVDGCGQITIDNMPQDTEIHRKRAGGPHNAPYDVFTVGKGETWNVQ